MADFVAVLRKTIDGLADPTPELRQRVYAKARATIEQKLVALNAPDAVVAKQTKALDDAIAEVEAGFTPVADDGAEIAAPEPLIEPVPVPVAPPPPVAVAPVPVQADPPAKTAAAPDRDPAAAPAFTSIQSQPDALEDFLTHEETNGGRRAPLDATDSERPGEDRDRDPADRDDDLAAGTDEEERSDYGVYTRGPLKQPPAKRSMLPLLGGLVLLLLIAGVGYAGYTWRDTLAQQASAVKTYLANLTGGDSNEAGTPAETAANQPAPQPGQAEQPAANQPAANQPATPAPTPQPNEPKGEPKLTQRLLPDGQEIDPGPANDTPSIGEGTSVAASSPDQAAPQPGGQAPAGQTQPPAALPIGQKAFFYEERSGQDAGTAEAGGVVWSVVQESPGNDLPPEPAIRAEVTIPERDIKLRLVIRRNGDKTLPASHLIEMIFTVPQGFAGGSIDNVSRMTFKDTEQAPGSPLVAIPAKIADNFFIIAMNDAKTALDTNLSLMRRQSWIDIPISYKTGRRALITLEKGLPGERAFDEVLKSWAAKAGG
ncbi:MAG: transcriptional regulator [Phyllobacterium sp.]